VFTWNKLAGFALMLALPGLLYWANQTFVINLVDVVGFYISESSLSLFALKVICSVALLLGLSMLVAGRMEVRR
jgi:hypothetical protein